MAKRRKQYRGTSEQHATDAADIARDLRWVAKGTVLRAEQGDCNKALLEYGLVQRKLGAYAVSKAYALHRLSTKPRRAQSVLSVPAAISRTADNARKAVDACYRRRRSR